MSLISVILLISIYLVIKKVGEARLRELLIKSLGDENLAFMSGRIITYIIYALLITTFLSAVGVPIQNLLMAGGILTLAVSFAAQTVISNAISGMFLMIERPLKIGDFVELKNSGISGKVQSFNIFSTLLLTIDGELARVPNSTFFNDIIINKTGTVARRLQVRVGVSYSDALKALEVFRNYFSKHPDVLQVPEPEIFIEDFGDFYVLIRLNLWVPTKKWYDMYKSIREEIFRVCQKYNIEIPFPVHIVYLKDQR